MYKKEEEEGKLENCTASNQSQSAGLLCVLICLKWQEAFVFIRRDG